MARINPDQKGKRQNKTPSTKKQTTPPDSAPNAGKDDNDSEKRWKEVLESLKRAMITYDQAAKSKDEKAGEAAAENVVSQMRTLESIHPDPAVKKEWGDKADKFAKAGKEERGIMSNDIVKGLALLLATPFLLAGAVIFAAGTIIYGAGSLVKGIGNLLTFGQLGSAGGEQDPADKD